ncbi:MAG: AI-2E family transporter [Kiloniellales bacterium]
MTVERQIRFWLIGLVIFLVAVFVLRGILLPFIAGMAVAYLLDPTCDRFEKWGMSRTLATTLLTVMFLIVAVTAVLVFVPLLAGQVARLLERTPQYFDALRVQLTALLTILEARVDPAMFEGFQGAMAGTAEKLAGWLTGMLGRLVSGGVALANLFSLILITPVVAFYLLRDWDRLVARVDTWLPRSHVEVIREQAREVDRTLAGFLRGQGAVCLILGSFYAVGLTAAGLDFGLVIGLIAGVLTFIPYFGAIVGLVLSVGLALVQFDDWMRVAIVAGIFVIGQVIEGNFLTPKLVGESVGLHPVWVIFGLFAGGALFGFVGVLLAIPITAVVGVGARFALTRYMQSPYYRAGEGRPDG